MFAQSRDRTDDLRVTNALLYQLSYLGEKRKDKYKIGGIKKPRKQQSYGRRCFLGFPPEVQQSQKLFHGVEYHLIFSI